LTSVWRSFATVGSASGGRLLLGVALGRLLRRLGGGRLLVLGRLGGLLAGLVLRRLGRRHRRHRLGRLAGLVRDGGRRLGALGRDRRGEHRLAALDLEDDGGLDGIAVGVDRDLAGHAREVLGGPDRGRQVLAAQRRRAVHRVEQDARRVVAERGQAVGRLAVVGLVLLDERLHLGALLVGRVMVRVVAALDRVAADLGELGRVPAVAADERRLDAELPGLAEEVAGLGVVAGEEHRLRAGVLDRLQLRGHVGVATGVRLLGGDGAAELDEGLLEVAGQALRVRLRLVVEDGDLVGLQVLAGELRRDVALEGVDEADAEDHVAELRDAHVRRRRRDHRHAVLLGDAAAGERRRRRDLAEDGDDLLVVDEAGDDGAGLGRLRRGVEGDQLDRAALHAAGGVALLDGELDAVVRRDAEGGLGAGHRAVVADLDGTGALGSGRGSSTATTRLSLVAVAHLVAAGGEAERARDREKKRHTADPTT
jgi:hypothetical protein